MHTEGLFAPATAEEARERFEAVGPTAQTTVREVAKAMDFDGEEYDRRVTPEVVATARETIFASLLEVYVGTREEYEEWAVDNPGYDVELIGSDQVDNVVWHPAPFADQLVAATFQDREAAAVGTLRRQAFGRIYREVVTE
jgi:hypothetical protein